MGATRPGACPAIQNAVLHQPANASFRHLHLLFFPDHSSARQARTQFRLMADRLDGIVLTIKAASLPLTQERREGISAGARTDPPESHKTQAAGRPAPRIRQALCLAVRSTGQGQAFGRRDLSTTVAPAPARGKLADSLRRRCLTGPIADGRLIPPSQCRPVRRAFRTWSSSQNQSRDSKAQACWRSSSWGCRFLAALLNALFRLAGQVKNL